MEIRAVWEKLIHISDPLVDLNFGTDSAKSAFTGMRYSAYFTRVVGVNIGRVTKPIRFSATHDLPDIESDSPGNQCRMNSKKRIPIFLKNEF